MRMRRTHKLLVAAAALIIIAAGVMATLLMHHRSKTPTAKPTVITYSTDKPSETPPPKDYEWVGGDADPKRIIIPSLGINGYIQQVGVDQNKQVAVPNNIHMAGWFASTVRPGQKGLSIIDGHVDGHREAGIFKNLVRLKPGDQLTVELGGGQTLKYAVKTVSSIDTAEAANALFSQDPQTTSQLNLITCGGTFDTKAKAYTKRVVVTSALL